jgi:demethylmenaquinone methyltransferase/2-methoxy-6-polyprenyl-1,4-benzoquinol methylase
VRGEPESARKVYQQSYVRGLFDAIAPRYDFLNHFLSLGIDISWRRRAIRLLEPYKPRRILDVATGTGDLAIEASRLMPGRIVGIDISKKMIDIGKQKIRAKNLESVISFESGDAERLEYESGSFDAITVAFGVRNFSDLKKGLSEFYRVLRRGGVAVILEFSKPRSATIARAYGLYSRHVLPRIGGFVSRNREAYEYLPNTIAEFPDGAAFCSELRDAGFAEVQWYPQTFGIAALYRATK